MKNKRKNVLSCKNNETAMKVEKRMQSILSDSNQKSKTDPNGSYTGVADPPFENVVQDADDL